MYGAAQYMDYKSKTKLHNVQVLLNSCQKESGGWNGWCNGLGKMRQCKGCTDLSSCVLLLGQHHCISRNGHCAGSTRIQGWVWWDVMVWLWSGTIRNSKGQLVEIGTSHQIRWNILREHNWGVPSAHIMFIYYVTCIVEYLIILQGCARTGVYTIL